MRPMRTVRAGYLIRWGAWQTFDKVAKISLHLHSEDGVTWLTLGEASELAAALVEAVAAEDPPL